MKKFKEFLKEKPQGFSMAGGKSFSKEQILRLKNAWSTIERIDPTSKAYQKLDNMLENMSIEDLESIVSAKIKFVSSLALAKVVRKSRGR